MRATVERGIEEGIVMFPIGPGNSHQGDVLTFGTRDSEGTIKAQEGKETPFLVIPYPPIDDIAYLIFDPTADLSKEQPIDSARSIGYDNQGRIIHITLRGLSAEIGLLHNQLPLASDALEQATRLVTAYQAAYKDPLQNEPREYRFIPIPQIPLAA